MIGTSANGWDSGTGGGFAISGDLWLLLGLFVALGAIGAILTYRAFRAFQFRRSTPMLLLGSGIAILSVGMPITWTAMYTVSGNELLCSVASAAAALVGVAVILASIQLRSG